MILSTSGRDTFRASQRQEMPGIIVSLFNREQGYANVFNAEGKD